MSIDDNDGPDVLDAAEIQQLTAIARSITPEDQELEPLPDDIWAGIEAELDLGGASTASNGPGGDVQSMSDWRRRAWRPLAAVAAAVAVIAGIVGVTVVGGGDDPVVVAEAMLDPLADGYNGAAFVQETADGVELRLDIGDLPPEDGFYELWLIKDLETGQMQSLGPIDGGGIVAWPDGFDPGEYAVVDISIEPRDGVPTHSGVSVLRGTLQS